MLSYSTHVCLTAYRPANN